MVKKTTQAKGWVSTATSIGPALLAPWSNPVPPLPHCGERPANSQHVFKISLGAILGGGGVSSSDALSAVRTAEGERWRARAERFEDGGPFDSPGVSSPPPAPRPGPHGGGGPPPWPPHLSTGWASPPPCATAASSSSSALEPSGTTAIPSPAPPQSSQGVPPCPTGDPAWLHLRSVAFRLGGGSTRKCLSVSS